MESSDLFSQENQHEIQKWPTKILRGMPEYLEMQENRENLDVDTHPQYIMMNLETTCSFSCPKCAQPGKNREMGKPLSLGDRKNILTVAASAGARELVIIGAGEPSTPKNFKDTVRPTIEAAHKSGMGTILFTTALGIDKAQAEFYREHDVTIFISLDSLRPDVYRKLTGTGNLSRTLENIKILRQVYSDTSEISPDGRKIVRLAINVTVQKDNATELDELKKFAGDDMQFIANVPMPEGKLRSYKDYQELVGGAHGLEELRRLASERSDTGSHSSVAEGTCSYFNRGISIDSDGQLLTCGYASDSAHHLGNVTGGITRESLLGHYQRMRGKYIEWCRSINRKPSCPLRDDDYEQYIKSLGEVKI